MAFTSENIRALLTLPLTLGMAEVDEIHLSLWDVWILELLT